MTSKEPIHMIMCALAAEYIATLGQVLIGAHVEFDAEKENWISPWAQNFSEKYRAKKHAAEVLKELRNNSGSDSKVRFYEHLQKLYEIDIQFEGIRTEATCAMLANEICNFSRPFSIRV